eukprot:TRINITY_DN4180_c0_g1_i1.p1 TRINITY_DN4180_c0_g1~~TRINITY_DN4180_c0_g1_i1.p1  ORF type:complete len:218 (-),score=45.87 TRINITY_DN4180_c0_g1_i1:330-983(-)
MSLTSQDKRKRRWIGSLIVVGAAAWISWSLYQSVALEYWKRRRQPNRMRKVNRLRNTFYIMRHGQSMANVEGIISSDPDVATLTHGLSPQGKEEARKGANEFVQMLTDHMATSPSPARFPSFDESPRRLTMTLPDVVVYCSPFLRAKETAQIVCDVVNSARRALFHRTELEDLTPIEHVDLRERYFGELDGKSDDRYADVWSEDSKDPEHHQFHVER